MGAAANTPVGSVLLIAVDGSLTPSRVLGPDGKKLAHVGLNGERRTINPARPLWTSARCCHSDEELAAYWEAVASKAQGIDLERLWLDLQTDGRLGEHRPAALAERLDPAAAGPMLQDALILAAFTERLHFRVRKGRIVAVTPKALHEARTAKARREKMARHLKIATELLSERLRGGSGRPDNDDETEAIANHIEWLQAVALHAKDSKHYKSTLTLMRGLAERVDSPQDTATALLIALGVWAPHENVPLRRAGLPTAHRPEVVDAATELSQRIVDPTGRVDYRDLLTVAIDAEHTAEVDDAFAIDGERLYVFIADAAAWVPQDSAVFAEAADRVSTLYLPEHRWPMLPATLGERMASLQPHQDRLALAYSFVVSGDGALRDFTVERAIVRVDQRLTYDEVDAALGGPELGLDVGDNELSGAVAELVFAAAQRMKAHGARRDRDGAMTFTRDEVHLKADQSTGDVSVEVANPNGPARQLVAEMMVAACGGAGFLCMRERIPSIFRAQEPPDEPIEKPPGRVTDAWSQWNILRRFKPSRMTLSPAQHYSLALPAYIQVSSPLRRFGDLLMNFQLSAFAAGEPPPFDQAALRTHLDHIERRSSELRSVEQQSRRYWALWYLETHPDTVLTGLVVHEVGRRWVVRLPELALIVTLSPRRKLKRSQKIRLRVADVSARRDKLVLAET